MNRFLFIHLNVHSHYSINDGCANIMELVDAAIKDKMPGVAITDNSNMFGMMEFFDYEFHCTCQAARRFFGHNLPNHQLQTVAAECGYCLKNHHHALADAEACAWIAREIL